MTAPRAKDALCSILFCYKRFNFATREAYLDTPESINPIPHYQPESFSLGEGLILTGPNPVR